MPAGWEGERRQRPGDAAANISASSIGVCAQRGIAFADTDEGRWCRVVGGAIVADSDRRSGERVSFPGGPGLVVPG